MMLTRDSFELNMESSSCVDKWRMRAFCQEGFFVSRHVTLVSVSASVSSVEAHMRDDGTHAKSKSGEARFCHEFICRYDRPGTRCACGKQFAAWELYGFPHEPRREEIVLKQGRGRGNAAEFYPQITEHTSLRSRLSQHPFPFPFPFPPHTAAVTKACHSSDGHLSGVSQSPNLDSGIMHFLYSYKCRYFATVLLLSGYRYTQHPVISADT